MYSQVDTPMQTQNKELAKAIQKLVPRRLRTFLTRKFIENSSGETQCPKESMHLVMRRSEATLQSLTTSEAREVVEIQLSGACLFLGTRGHEFS